MTPKAKQQLASVLQLVMPIAWLIGFLVIALHWSQTSGPSISRSLGAALVAIGGLAGITGAYLALTQLMLQSRLPLLELPFGRAALVAFHRKNGYAVITVLLLHATLVLVGYAVQNEATLLEQEVKFLTTFPYVLWSSIALTLLVAVVAASITIVRRKLKYETWFFVHLMTYGAILLAFNHQLAVGVEFVGMSQAAWRAYWWTLYLLTFGSLLVFRFGRPAYLAIRHNFRVDRVVPEADNINSIYITGRGLKHLKYEAGQFMIWRFLDSERWWQAHPFTISQAYNGRELRLTFKNSGDFTANLARVKPGTRVVVDGPHGDFVLPPAPSQQLLFIAGGIGLTPLRAMLETIGADSKAQFVYAARTSADLALTAELDAIAKAKQVTIHYVLSDESKPGYARGVIDAAMIGLLVPDFANYEVYLCGPPPMMAGVRSMLETAGIDPQTIHSERFAF